MKNKNGFEVTRVRDCLYLLIVVSRNVLIDRGNEFPKFSCFRYFICKNTHLHAHQIKNTFILLADKDWIDLILLKREDVSRLAKPKIVAVLQ